jgi:crossover junction endodeoxyribonuclease RusA
VRPTVLVLPYPVSANRYWRHGLIKGHPATFRSKEAKAYIEQVGYIAKAAGLRLPYEGRVLMDLKLYPQRPLDFAKRACKNPDGWDDDVRCMDLGNCEKVLQDALNGIAYLDDKQLWRVTKERMEPTGDEHIVVTLSKYERARIAPDLFAAAG